MTKNLLDTDVCIIGCGPAGITVARELSEAGARVIILESGHLDEDPFAQALLDGRATGPVIKGCSDYLSRSRSARVQGSASRWGGWTTPFTPIDFEQREWINESGWPFNATDLAPFAVRAAGTLGIRPFGTVAVPLPEHTDHEIGPLVPHTYHYTPNCSVFRDHFITLLKHQGFQAELGTTAISLVARDGQVQRVRALTTDGEDLYVNANIFVLAAGGIENARMLLLNAGDGKMGITANPAALGRYFQEHFHVLAGKARVPNARKWRDYLRIVPNPTLGHSMLRTVVLTDECQRREGLLNTSVEISAATLNVADVDDAVEADGSIECDIFVRSEQEPNPESRVVLSEDRDQLGRPRTILHWNTSPLDWGSIIKSVSIVTSELERKWRVQTKTLIHRKQPWPWAPVEPESARRPWGHHHMGTTRMTNDAALGVVDSNCRVHGTSNLYVAGSSVFPTSSFANPTFSIVTLSIRLADHLTTQLASVSQ
jgi:choline dehydrogenase-like flavoprotein